MYGDTSGPLDTDGHSVAVAIPFDTTQITSAANYSVPRAGDPCHPLAAGAHVPAIAFAQNQRDDIAMPLRSNDGSGNRQAMAWSIMPQNSGKDYKAREVDVAQPVMGNGPVGGNQGGDYIQVQALCEGGHGVTEMDTATAVQSGGGKAGQGYQAVRASSSVRRLTPRECERLQGFPDGWTDVVYRGKAAADGPRYRALGNAFAVPVVRWIARRMVREDAASAQAGVLAA